jgi:hypothetical protein
VRPEFLHFSMWALHLTLSSGTGKTVFLFYVLLQSILDAQPTLLRYVGGLALGFSEKGVERFEREVTLDTLARAEAYPSGTWALLDTQFTELGNDTGTPTGIFESPNLYVMLTTSPEVTRFKEWQEQASASLTIMEPWSWEEYAFAA